jgi:hypothetical protein
VLGEAVVRRPGTLLFVAGLFAGVASRGEGWIDMGLPVVAASMAFLIFLGRTGRLEWLRRIAGSVRTRNANWPAFSKEQSTTKEAV